jgi:error-prone DNA polymerase
MPESPMSLQGRVASGSAAEPSASAAIIAPTDTAAPDYAELHCISNFSFQRGASHPDELALRALELGYTALAITDECSVAGVVRAWDALREERKNREKEGRSKGEMCASLQLIFGSEFLFPEGHKLIALARDLEGWGGLCQFITAARRVAPKGEYKVDWRQSNLSLLAGCELIFVPQRLSGTAIDIEANSALINCAIGQFGLQFFIAAELLQELDDALWRQSLEALSARTGCPLVAAGDVHMHAVERKPLQDVLTAVHQGCSVDQCGFALQRNAQRYLRSRQRVASVYPAEWVARTLEIASRCHFDLAEIAYRYPLESVPPGMTPAQALRRLVEEGAARRFPRGTSEKLQKQIEHELSLIAHKRYEMYFLTVEDIVRFARSQKILCQGRGSAANSAVCYCLFITEVNPEFSNLLFERFISMERNEPPDIDVDFEHQRREEVIQYIYAKYGRERAAIAAVVVRYRSRMALREAGKALGVNTALVDDFARDHYWFDKEILQQRMDESMARAGVVESPALIALWLRMAGELRDFPRHLSQHVGGFVLTEGPLSRLVPVENASMQDRSIIQWEKDDLEAVGLMKVDVLALGMLSALRRGLALRNAWRGSCWQLQDIPREDAQVYDMICTADTVGVFQIESRAQMSMLPRLRPRVFYDLVVEVAIVRPGPIQGGMVHPYLKARQRRREGKEILYIKDELKYALERTLGVPIFQEQVMQLSMDAAGFTAGQADALRRSMAAWSRKGGVHQFEEPLVQGMTGRGYPLEFAQGIFEQIKGFGEYGFPESHAASFALLVYFSCWLKCHEPAAFLAGMLDAQPMGFYTPSQLVQDARRHGVEVRPVDVATSGIDTVLEMSKQSMRDRWPLVDGIRPEAALGLPAIALPGERVWSGTTVPQPVRLLQPAVRLCLRRVAGLGRAAMQRIVSARAEAPFASAEDLALRAQLDAQDMRALAAADALKSLAGHRRQQVWEATAQRLAPALLRGVPINELPLELPAAPEGEEIVGDYAALGLTLRRHPLALLRPRLARRGLLTAQQLAPMPDGRKVRACGIVSMRQRPPTAKGTLFVTLEDETGVINVIVWRDVVEAHRDALLKSRLLAVEGVWQRDIDSGGQVRHLLGRRFRDLTPWLGRLGEGSRSRDFH